jgi:hypothetical protein
LRLPVTARARAHRVGCWGGRGEGETSQFQGCKPNQRARPTAPRASLPPVRPPVALATCRQPWFILRPRFNDPGTLIFGGLRLGPASPLLPSSAQIVRRPKHHRLDQPLDVGVQSDIHCVGEQTKNHARIAQGKRLHLDASVSAKLLTSRGST